MIFREVPFEDREDAAALAQEWGFPRVIAWAEWSEGIWITNTEGNAFAWLVKGPLHKGHYLLHAQLRPDPNLGLRARVPSAEILAALRTVASVAGASRLYAGLGNTRPGWRRFLMKTGYFEGEDSIGPFMILE